MDVSVILLSVDEAPNLERSLPLALAQEPAPAEVLVVDNDCHDETAEVAERHAARVLRLSSRRTYAQAINASIAATGGEAVLLLNADCFLRPGFLAAALPHLAAEWVGSVAPKLVRAGVEGQAQIDAAGMVVDRRRKNGLVGHGAPATAFATAAPVFGPDGAAALYRREALSACALDDGEVLDEDMELWASDADLAWRAQLLGWRSVYEPAAVADHVRTYSPSTRGQMSRHDRRLQFRNRYLMMLKNDTAAGLIRDLPRLAAYEALALGYALLREPYLLGGYRDVWRLRHGALRRRRQVQSMRRASPPFGLRAPA